MEGLASEILVPAAVLAEITAGNGRDGAADSVRTSKVTRVVPDIDVPAQVAVPTEAPWIRVDITLKATLPHGKPMAMPGPAAMGRWFHEIKTRLELTEPLTAEEKVRDEEGGLSVLAWKQAEPCVHALCRPSGDLTLDGVELAAWQAVTVPRIFDDLDREPDEGPEEELAALFGRTRGSLSAWMQALDHLRG